MAEDQYRTDNVEIEPLSEEELEQVAGGNEMADSDSGVGVISDTSTGPSCCSCRDCS